MISNSIIITALARDCAENLKHNIKRIEQLRSYFAKSYVVVLENDSKDNTPFILREWEASSKGVRCISEPIPSGVIIESQARKPKYEGKSLRRISKMAYLRNRLLEITKDLGDYDYYMLIDIDVYSFSVEGVLHALLNAPSDWGGLFANGRQQYRIDGCCIDFPVQYDVYAFFKEKEDYMSLNFHYLNARNQFNRAKFMSDNITRQEYFACLSAFGGIGIYKYSLLRDLTYSAIVPEKWKGENICLCEHLSVNSQIVEQGNKCYIARSLEASYGISEKTGIRGLLFRLSPLNYLRMCRLLYSLR